MNGDPLSFQIWTNQQMRFGDIKYHMKFWDYRKKESDLIDCINVEGVCPSILFPTSLNKNTTSNALLVKQFASLYIQPVANEDITCTVMVLENLAKPEWISVPCAEKILTDVVCVKESMVNGDQYPGFDQKRKDLEVASIIFQCNNGKMISSIRQCDGFMDCSAGDDEKRCSCFVRFQQINNSHYCRYNCKRPECFCLEMLFQSHTTGCFQYKPLVSVQHGKTEHSKLNEERNLLFTCPNETLRLEGELVNDLIPDCKSNADENIIHLMLTGKYKHNLTQMASKYNSKEHRHCFNGHPKLYHVKKECMYQVNKKGILQTCRNGKHLQDCSKFNCQKYFKFKCPRYYCIPMGYVCDGKIDCPGGFDEINCMNHSCIGLFHCFSTSQCIFVADVCDGVKDCVNGDDEFNCELQKSKCPKQCFCLGFAVSCNYSFQSVFSIGEVVQNRTYVSVIGNKLLWDFRCLQSCQTVQFLILSGFELFDFCNSLISFKHELRKVIRIVLHKNSIALLRMHCFVYDSSILSLNFSNNIISVVEKFTFSGLDVLKVLDLSNNKIHSLNTKSFTGLRNMMFLKINQNPLQFIHIHLLQELIHLKFIYTNNFRLCCIKPRLDIICNSMIQWPASCKDLISNLVISLSMWIVMSLVLILNLSSIVNFIKVARKLRNKKISTFQIIAVFLNISDFACGMYLAIIISSNNYFKGSYAINELHWRSHIACYTASCLFTFFQISSLSTVGIMTLARLLVVIDPYQSKFPISSLRYKSLLSVTLSISLMSVLLTSLMMYLSETKLLPNGLCSIFYDPMGHTVYKVSAIVLSFLQLIICFGVICMYLIIYNRMRATASFTEQISKVDNFLHRKMIFRIVLITVSNIACWVPSGIIYIFSTFKYKFPIDILLYTTIYITPVNSIINPVFITFVNTKDNL